VSDESFPVRRFRRTDYVGSPIWGFAVDVPLGRPLRAGDRCFFNLPQFVGGDRVDVVVDKIDGRFACRYADDGSFAGFITNQ
jgi:hypothetical protein